MKPMKSCRLKTLRFRAYFSSKRLETEAKLKQNSCFWCLLRSNVFMFRRPSQSRLFISEGHFHFDSSVVHQFSQNISADSFCHCFSLSRQNVQTLLLFLCLIESILYFLCHRVYSRGSSLEGLLQTNNRLIQTQSQSHSSGHKTKLSLKAHI